MANIILAETPFFSIDYETIIPVLCNTIILFLILKHFLFKPVNRVLDARKQEVEDVYANAHEAEGNAKKLEAEYSARMAGVKEESAKILQTAQPGQIRAATRS